MDFVEFKNGFPVFFLSSIAGTGEDIIITSSLCKTKPRDSKVVSVIL